MVYLFDNAASAKQARARQLLQEEVSFGRAILSTHPRMICIKLAPLFIYSALARGSITVLTIEAFPGGHPFSFTFIRLRQISK